MAMRGGRGWLNRLLAEGTDPDARFSMANERTFLAWIRTALALIAAGIGLDAFAAHVLPSALRTTLACGLLLLGGALAATAFTRWLRSERALRTGRSLPVLGVAPVLAVGVSLCAVALVVGVLLR